ncbi:hypothetical protein LINGRAHAP2_LOCUS15977 [Linum grandiflorum]
MGVQTKFFILNIVATFTETMSNGDLACRDIKNERYSVDRALMLNEESALVKMRQLVDALKIPMSRKILKMVMTVARQITDGKFPPFLMHEGQPFATILIDVEKGEVPKVKEWRPRFSKAKMARINKDMKTKKAAK